MLDMLKEAVSNAVEPIKYLAGATNETAVAVIDQAVNTTVIDQAVNTVDAGWFAWAYDHMYEGAAAVAGVVTLGGAYKNKESIANGAGNTVNYLNSFRKHKQDAAKAEVEVLENNEENAVDVFADLKAALLNGDKALSEEKADAVIAKVNDHQDRFANKAFFDAFVENMQTKSETGLTTFTQAKPVIVNVVLNQIAVKAAEKKEEAAPKNDAPKM